MKVCLSCSRNIQGNAWLCQSCGWEPTKSGDVYLFAPEISGASEGYDPVWYAELASLEAGNFWFVARNRLIHWLSKRYLPEKAHYLEVGCGTGFVLQMLHKTFQEWTFFATEAQPEGLEFAKQRLPNNVTFFQMNALAIPFREAFDVIGAFDVIEHIREDEAAISQIHAALKPDGIFILSVPQHMFLWSRYDEAGHHFRRYSAKELEEKLTKAGFSIKLSTSFNALLLPLMMLSRFLKNRKEEGTEDVLDEMRLSSFMNKALSFMLRIEFLLMKLGLRFPFGGSRVVVAQKISV